MMDKIQVHQNLLFAFQEAGQDVTVLPLSINLDFLSKWRPGAGFKYGKTQEFKFEFLDMQVALQDCQNIGGGQPEAPKKENTDED